MSVQYENYLVQVQAALQDALEKALLEVGSEIESKTKRNTPVRTGQLKGSWRHELETNGDTVAVHVGSPFENAIWNEFGTGEYAVNKDGRKGGWWIKVGNGENEISPIEAKRYSWDDYRYKDGQLAYVFTYGKPPQRSLQRAYIAKKNWAVEHIENELKKIGKNNK